MRLQPTKLAGMPMLIFASSSGSTDAAAAVAPPPPPPPPSPPAPPALAAVAAPLPVRRRTPSGPRQSCDPVHRFRLCKQALHVDESLSWHALEHGIFTGPEAIRGIGDRLSGAFYIAHLLVFAFVLRFRNFNLRVREFYKF
jgi:hypothetical protein